MAKKTITPGGSIDGVVELPGDKSISHRYAIIAALAEGKSEIANYASAADCRSTLECLRRLGVEIEVSDRLVRVAGVGLGGLKEPRRPLDAENSGSTMRMLAGVLAGQPFTSTLTGDDSLRKRPMRRVIEPLRQMGAEIESREGDRAPIEIRGGQLHAIDYTTPIPSAQVKSAILLAGLFADGVTTVRESVCTRDHTEVALREFGADIEGKRGTLRIHPRPKLTGSPAHCAGRSLRRSFFDCRGAGAAGVFADAPQRRAESIAGAGDRLPHLHRGAGSHRLGAVAKRGIGGRRGCALRAARGWSDFRRAGGGNDRRASDAGGAGAVHREGH